MITAHTSKHTPAKMDIMDLEDFGFTSVSRLTVCRLFSDSIPFFKKKLILSIYYTDNGSNDYM